MRKRIKICKVFLLLILCFQPFNLISFKSLASPVFEEDNNETEDEWAYQVIDISEKSLTLLIDDSDEREFELTAYGDPNDEEIKWSSSDSSIVSVNSVGKVKAKKKGFATITATGKESKRTASCYVQVVNRTIPVEKIEKIGEGEIKISEGQTKKLPYKISPSDATDKDCLFLVEDPDIGYVDSTGMFTGKEDGSTDVTIQTKDGEYQTVVHVIVVSYKDSKLNKLTEDYPGVKKEQEVKQDEFIWVKIQDAGWMLYNTIKGNWVTGWVEVGKNWYYIDSSKVGIRKNNSWSLQEIPIMKVGWIEDKNKWYFADASGSIQKGWILNNNKWYYLNITTGEMQTGRLELDRKIYFLNNSGVCVNGWFTDDTSGKTYYSNPVSMDVNLGWFKVEDKWYYSDYLSLNIIKDKWILDNGKEYYLSSDGSMLINTTTPDGYTVDENGVKN